jgi:hypothetical protein
LDELDEDEFSEAGSELEGGPDVSTLCEVSEDCPDVGDGVDELVKLDEVVSSSDRPNSAGTGESVSGERPVDQQFMYVHVRWLDVTKSE